MVSVRPPAHPPREYPVTFRQAGAVVVAAVGPEPDRSRSLWPSASILLLAAGLLLLAGLASPRVLRGAVLGLADRRVELVAAAASLLLGLAVAHVLSG